MGRWRSLLAAILLTCLMSALPVSASETVTYAYDARGRLVSVVRSGTVNDGVSASYSYDRADNRADVSVSFRWTTRAWRAGDFNGDRRDDVLWRRDEGQISDWLGASNGGFIDNANNASQFLANIWFVAGLGDFNGDGRDDILWRRDDGAMTNWLGTTSGSFADNSTNASDVVSPIWHIAGIGDFNGDGRDDILWSRDDGALTNWLGQANGGFVSNGANASTVVSRDWRIVGTGDFNGDGRDDILWRKDSGDLSNWLGQPNGGWLDNNAIAGTVVENSWKVIGTGDFNGDSRDDILWRHIDGRLTNWLGTPTGGYQDNAVNALNSVDPVWRVVATGDYNGDGRTDILWRRNIGTLSNWLGTSTGGFADNAANAVNEVPTYWQVERR